MASHAPVDEPRVDTGADGPAEDGHSGRLLLRMPRSLHSELARAAEREGVSLNAYITSALAATVHWRAGAGESRSSGLVRAALIADLVLVALTAAAAIVLLAIAAL
jgi:HicB family